MDKYTIIVYVAGVLGMLAHPIKRIIKKETMSSIVKYYTGNWKHSVAAVGATMSLVTAVTYADVCANVAGMYCYYLLVSGAATAGYTFDSAINKDGGEE